MNKKIMLKNGMNFEINNSDYTAQTIYSPGLHDDVVIPRSIIVESQEYIVTKIGENTFKRNTNIHSVKFPDDTEVKIIANNSFYNCSIKEFSLPYKVNFIGENAFVLCFNLKTIEIPENSELLSIGSNAFKSSPIESISIPSKVNDLKSGWCNRLRKLVTVSISPKNTKYSFIEKEKVMIEKVNDLSENLVFACRDIEKVSIRPNIKRICSSAFSDCEHLSRVDFDENSELEFIDERAFSNCFSLKKIEIPFRVKKIFSDAFSKCRKMKSVEFSENSELESIESGGFSWTNVEYVTFPRKVRCVGVAAFIACPLLKSVEFLCDDDVSIGKRCFNQCRALLVASFPNANKVCVSYEAFESCSSDFSLFIRPNGNIIYSSNDC